MSIRQIFFLVTILTLVAFGLSLFVVFSLIEEKPVPAVSSGVEEEIIEPEPEATLLAVGDIMMARQVETLMTRYGQEYPLSEVKDRLKQPDITFGNLECAVSDKGNPLPGKGIWLRAKPEVMPELKDSGFDVLSVANNHSLDYDAEAFLDTLGWLQRYGIAQVGGGTDINQARAPYIMTVKGIRVGFLAYSEMTDVIWSYQYPRKLKATETEPGVAPFEYESVLADVQALSSQVDILVLSLHWGTEYSHSPSDIQRDQAHGLIDAGADIIIGHHPHVVQGVEVYKQGLVAYSLGNFVFDQNRSRHTQEGLALEVKFKNSGISNVRLLPVIIPESQPRFDQSPRAKAFAEEVRQYSLALGTKAYVTENPLDISLETETE